MNESVLLKSARKLDQGALVTIFDTYAPAVYRYSFRLCLDAVEADNIVGDVFTRFLEVLATNQGPVTNLRSYIFQITYRTICGRTGNSQQRVREAACSKAEFKLASTADHSDNEDRLLRRMIAFLNSDLSENQRHVLLLRYLEEFSLSETAFIVGKSVSTVKVIQSRGIAKLRSSLGFPVEDRKQNLASKFDTRTTQ
jgi:RNA polymerase sigma-70 factor (ECF subfamily)